jgi:hypothetical protein
MLIANLMTEHEGSAFARGDDERAHNSSSTQEAAPRYAAPAWKLRPPAIRHLHRAASTALKLRNRSTPPVRCASRLGPRAPRRSARCGNCRFWQHEIRDTNTAFIGPGRCSRINKPWPVPALERARCRRRYALVAIVCRPKHLGLSTQAPWFVDPSTLRSSCSSPDLGRQSQSMDLSSPTKAAVSQSPISAFRALKKPTYWSGLAGLWFLHSQRYFVDREGRSQRARGLLNSRQVQLVVAY